MHAATYRLDDLARSRKLAGVHLYAKKLDSGLYQYYGGNNYGNREKQAFISGRYGTAIANLCLPQRSILLYLMLLILNRHLMLLNGLSGWKNLE
jgi:hypothetical protein